MVAPGEHAPTCNALPLNSPVMTLTAVQLPLRHGLDGGRPQSCAAVRCSPFPRDTNSFASLEALSKHAHSPHPPAGPGASNCNTEPCAFVASSVRAVQVEAARCVPRYAHLMRERCEGL